MPHPVPPPAPPPIVQVLPSDTASEASEVTRFPGSSTLDSRPASSPTTATLEPIAVVGVEHLSVHLESKHDWPQAQVHQSQEVAHDNSGTLPDEPLSEALDPSPPSPIAASPSEPEAASETSSRVEFSPRPRFQRPESPPSPQTEVTRTATDQVRQQRLATLGTSPIVSDPDAVPPARYGVQPLSVDLGRSHLPTIQSLDDQRILLDGENLPLEILQELQHLSGATLVAQSRGTPENPEGDRQILTIPGTGEDSLPLETDPRSIPLEDVPPNELPDPNTLPPDPLDQTEQPAIPSPDIGEAQRSPFVADVLELDADYQEFDTERDVFVAEGNVELRFRQAVLTADRIRVNLRNRQTLAEGNVVFRRGEQILLGNRLEYNLVQGLGTIRGVRGEVFLPTSDDDLNILPNDVAAQGLPNRPLDTQQRLDPPRAREGLGLGLGVDPTGRSNEAGFAGNIRRLRFEADDVEFYPNGWQASNVRITNDPFSPPELELRSHSVTYTRLSPFRAEIIARDPQLVFDQDFRLPLFQERIIIDSRRRNREPLATIGFDDDLGGLYLERPFNVITTRQLSFSVAPLILVQRAIEDNGFNLFDPTSLGLITRLDYDLSPRTNLNWRSLFESLELDNFDETFRTNVRLRQAIGRGPATHQLTLEYAYRNRFFNGSLRFQEVRRSIGFIVTSPTFILGDSRIALSYQAGAQYITARTDRRELFLQNPIGPRRREVSLWRGQASVALSRGFTLWQGTPLPPTREAGLRFNARPIVPFLRLIAGVRGVYSTYSNDDVQAGITASVGLSGVFGNHARDTFDYTEFRIVYSTSLQDGESPFRFDRAVDTNVLDMGFLQQIYGPFLFGIQTRLNLDTQREIDTVYTLEYRRRTYSVILRYSPVRESGSLNLQINDFDWGTLRDPFSGPAGAATVEGGVILSDE